MIKIAISFVVGTSLMWLFMFWKNRKARRELDSALQRVLEYQTLIEKHDKLDDSMILFEYVPVMKKLIGQMAMHDQITDQEVIKKAVALLYTIKESKIKHGTDVVLCVGNRPVQKLSGY